MKLEMLWEGSEIPTGLRGKTFDSFQHRRAREQYAICREWATGFNVGHNWKGLLLYGQHKGTGKTHLMAAIANTLIDKEVSVLFVAAPEWFARMRSDLDHAEGKIEALATVPVLLLDDIGQERPTEWTKEAYFRVLNARELSRLPTVATTNCRDLAPVIGEASASRLIGMTRLVKFDGIKDFRISESSW